MQSWPPRNRQVDQKIRKGPPKAQNTRRTPSENYTLQKTWKKTIGFIGCARLRGVHRKLGPKIGVQGEGKRGGGRRTPQPMTPTRGGRRIYPELGPANALLWLDYLKSRSRYLKQCSLKEIFKHWPLLGQRIHNLSRARPCECIALNRLIEI